MNAWNTKSLGELCDVVGGGTPAKNKPQFYLGDIPWATVRDMKSDLISKTEFKITKEAVAASATNVIPSGNVVIATRVGLGKVCLINQPTAINQDLRGIIPKNPKDLSVKYLFWWLKSIAFQFEKEGTGATVQGVKLPFVRGLLLPYPNFTEQCRISSILDEAFEIIENAKSNTEKNLRNAQGLFASRMQWLFAQDAAWERVQLEELLSRGWITSHLDGNHGSGYPKKEEFVDAGVPYIAARAIKNGSVDFSETKYLSAERAATIRKGIAKNGDVLFAHNATVGPVAVLKTAEDFVILGTSLTYYRCNPLNIHPEYLAHFMVSPAFTSQYAQVMKQSTRNQVPITKQREFFHIIPPIDVQLKIAQDLDELAVQTERFVDIGLQKLALLDDLKQSLLHQAFTGSLTAKFTEQQVAEVA